jgi:hypothetical protein
MSDFIGADLYCIASYADPKLNVDLTGGATVVRIDLL